MTKINTSLTGTVTITAGVGTLPITLLDDTNSKTRIKVSITNPIDPTLTVTSQEVLFTPPLFQFNISSSTQNANLNTLATAAGWNGVSDVQVTINSGVYLWSDNVSLPGFTVNIPNAVVINNGYIIGRGGNGGNGGGNTGQSGGLALQVTSTGVSITNNVGAYIAGGGGGGGANYGNGAGGAGGGAGGGYGGASQWGRGGGAGGAIGASGSNGGGLMPGAGGGAGGGASGSADYEYGHDSGGGGGGRILPGSGGSGALAGGSGGSAGNAGTALLSSNPDRRGGGGGGGWGAYGGTGASGPAGYAGGAGGRAITWSAAVGTLTNNASFSTSATNGAIWGAYT